MARIGATAAAAMQGIRRRLSRARDRLAARRSGLTPGRAALGPSPEPLATGDAEAAARLAAGEARMGGATRSIGRGSPFASAAPSQGWEAALHGFGWLDDAAAAARPDREALRGWAFDWMRRHGGGGGPGWTPALAGRRLARLAAHGGWLARAGDRREQALLERAVRTHIRFLSRRWAAAETGLGRLEAAAGLALGAVALADGGAARARATAALGAAAEGLVGVDGGVASRNPDELAAAFALLAWTHRALTEAGAEPDARHGVALHRAALALRPLRLGDGGLARFHGGGGAADETLDQAFALAGAAARGPRRDHAMGFLRLSAGRLAAVLDAAAPPPTGGASALGLELSLGRRRVFGSVGPGAGCGADWATAARATAAHSAVEVGGVSCARLEPPDWAGRVFGRRFALVPKVTHETAQDLDGSWARAEHDGYLARFGVMASRRLNLSVDGRTLRGEDALLCPDAEARKRFDAAAKAGGVPFVARFHLHPDIAAEAAADGRSARLATPEGAEFTLAAGRGRLSVEESAWIEPGAAAPRPTRQVAIAARAEAYWGRITWLFTVERVAAAAARAAAEPA